jgi:hypothetical protein
MAWKTSAKRKQEYDEDGTSRWQEKAGMTYEKVA